MKMVKIKITLLILVACFSSLRADGFKKYAGEFLSAGVGSRALGMGGAFVAVANDVTAGYWNPAGLVESHGLQFQFMHAKQFMSSIQYDYFGASKNLSEGSTIGLSLIRWGINDIKDTRNALNGSTISEGLDYSKITSFNIADYAFFISYAYQYTDDLFVGANVKIIYRDYASESAMGIGFDAGLKYRLFSGLDLGLMLRDITTTMMAWSTNEKEFITPSLRPGISYRFDIQSIDLYLQPSMDLAILFESRNTSAQLGWGVVSVDSFWGMETGFKDLLFLRLGYDDLSRFNAGIGVAIQKFGVDYSYTNFDQILGNVHRISFNLHLN
jgi:hypothetical protein